jgi:hypothetical protein
VRSVDRLAASPAPTPDDGRAEVRFLPLMARAAVEWLDAKYAQVPLSGDVAVRVIPNGAIGARFSADGETLYLTDVTGLGIYDFSNPASPQIRSHLPLPRCGGSGMYLVDVSDPADPAVRATRPAPARGVTVYDVRDLSAVPLPAPARADELAWVTGEDDTFAFDLTDPAAGRLLRQRRKLLGRLPRPVRLPAPGVAWQNR